MTKEEAPPPTLSRPDQLLDLARLVARAEFGGVALLSAQGEMVEQFTTGLSEEAALGLRNAPSTRKLVQFVLSQAGTVCLPGWPDGTAPAAASAPPRIGAFLGVPLTCPGRCRGVLYLCRSADEPFTPHDLEAVRSVSHFLEQGSLFEEARLLGRLRLLNQVAQAAASNLELAPVLRIALRELDRLLPMQVCAVWLVEHASIPSSPALPPAPAIRFPSSFTALPLPVPVPLLIPDAGAPVALVLADTTAGPGALPPGLRLDLVATPFASCVHDGEPLLADLDRGGKDEGGRMKDEGSSFILPPSSLSLGVRGAACCFIVPLRAGDRTVGLLHSVCLRASGFSNDQMQLFHLVADLLGPAISNCQFFGRLSSAYEALRQTQNQLVQTEKMRALGELAGGMAHEFNNALCGTLGFLELTLRDTALTAGMRDHLESARVCCLDAAQTVSRVQDFARCKPPDATVHVIDLDSLVQQSIELTRHKWESLTRARGTPIQVEVRTEARARVACSPNEIREVLTNLLFNAVDAMPEGGILKVRTWTDGPAVFFAVSDTGAGIPEAVRRRLFEPFFTTKGERGNGLGLSVSFGIVSRHGGEITVQSPPGKGATFTVRLPAHHPKVESPNAESATIQSFAPSVPNAVQFKSLRVLVVDDEESIRQFLDAGLTVLGHRPLLVGNAREALEAFARETFDVVLTDLGLPEVSGEEVARSVHRQSPSTPVVVLTGWADQLQSEGSTLEGVDRVLAKPITLATLATTLAAVCADAAA